MLMPRVVVLSVVMAGVVVIAVIVAGVAMPVPVVMGVVVVLEGHRVSLRSPAYGACGKARIAGTPLLQFDTRMRPRAGAGIVLVSLLLVACNIGFRGPVTENVLINGWSVGPEATCTGEWTCTQLITAATDWWDGQDAFHPQIVAGEVRSEGLYPNRDGDLGQLFRGGASGCCLVVLFQLADGSYRAFGVALLPAHLNAGVLVHDEGPGRRPGRTDPNPPPVETP